MTFFNFEYSSVQNGGFSSLGFGWIEKIPFVSLLLLVFDNSFRVSQNNIPSANWGLRAFC